MDEFFFYNCTVLYLSVNIHVYLIIYPSEAGVLKKLSLAGLAMLSRLRYS
jgi:hypothetical protein